MFQSQLFCRLPLLDRARFLAASPGLIGRRLLGLAAGAGAIAFIAAIAGVPVGTAVAPAPGMDTLQVITLRAASVVALRDEAEAVRASLLQRHGVGAVQMTGLRQQALVVEYSPRRIAGLGITEAELETALRVDPAHSVPGHIAVLSDDVSAVANTPVRAGAKVYRLGDVAAVIRTRAEPPVSTMSVEGQPAVRLVVVPTR